MDLTGRKWTLKQGRLFMDWLQDMEAIADTMAGRAEFTAESAILKEGQLPINASKPGWMITTTRQGRDAAALCYPYITCHRQLGCGALLLDQAALAADKIRELGSDHWDLAYYQGKIDAARFYIRNHVPAIMNLESILKYDDDTAITVMEEALGR
jgi:hypothetical protein